MTAWKVLGLAGTVMFTSRWIVQYRASRKAGRSVVPPTFWVSSFLGSTILVVYFACGPRADVVGMLGNVFPALVAGYNLVLIKGGSPTPRQPATSDLAVSCQRESDASA
jgi:lipid-A-disaccharide synthase-like uncharacterized protein